MFIGNCFPKTKLQHLPLPFHHNLVSFGKQQNDISPHLIGKLAEKYYLQMRKKENIEIKKKIERRNHHTHRNEGYGI